MNSIKDRGVLMVYELEGTSCDSDFGLSEEELNKVTNKCGILGISFKPIIGHRVLMDGSRMNLMELDANEKEKYGIIAKNGKNSYKVYTTLKNVTKFGCNRETYGDELVDVKGMYTIEDNLIFIDLVAMVPGKTEGMGFEAATIISRPNETLVSGYNGIDVLTVGLFSDTIIEYKPIPYKLTGGIVSDCDDLTVLIIDLDVCSIGTDTALVRNCRKLKKVHIKFRTDAIPSEALRIVENCPNLKEVYVSRHKVGFMTNKRLRTWVKSIGTWLKRCDVGGATKLRVQTR